MLKLVWASFVSPQLVDRDDPWMFQPAGDLRLQQEAGAAGGIVGEAVEDLLERDLAMHFGVQGHSTSSSIGVQACRSQV